MRLRRRVAWAIALVIVLTTIAGLATLAARARHAQTAADAAALLAQERIWHAFEALLAERSASTPPAAPSADRGAGPWFPGSPLATGGGPTATVPMQAHRLVGMVAAPSGGGRMASEAILERLSIAAGAVPVLTDAEGRLQAFPGSRATLARVAERLRDITPRTVELAVGDQVVTVATVPLRDATGAVIGARRWLTDVTERSWAQDRDDAFAAGALVGLALLVTVAVALWLRRSFQPLEAALSAQLALAEGDLSVALPGQDRADEIGAVARAMLAFRRNALTLRRRIRTDAWQQRLRQRFFAAELGGLAATLDAPDQTALRQALAAARAADDEGFAAIDAPVLRVMAGVVRGQQATMHRLTVARDAARSDQSRLVALDLELATVATLQARRAPASLPAVSGAEVAGQGLCGARFGGDLHDFFWFDGPDGRRLAVFVASVCGHGVDAAFLAVAARALVRALLPSRSSPGACLSQVSELLSHDNDARLPISAFLGVLDPYAQTLTAARAAAPPPVLLTRPGEARLLELPDGGPLGLRATLRVPEATIDLPARAALAVVSRGVPDTELGGGALGLDGYTALLAASPALDPEIVLAHAIRSLGAAGAARHGDASVVVARPCGGA